MQNQGLDSRPRRRRAGGAGEGNRTPMTSLEGWGSAIELHPRAATSRRSGGRACGHYGPMPRQPEANQPDSSAPSSAPSSTTNSSDRVLVRRAALADVERLAEII